jgi:predicted phage-related endonuclease
MVIESHKTKPGELHPLRAMDLTASAIGAVLGIDPHQPAIRVYGEKTGLLLPSAENNIMRRGRWFESAAIAAFREERPGWRIEPANVYLRMPEIRLGATPDAIAEDPDHKHRLVNVQIKTVTRTAFERDWPEPDGAPLHYVLQAMTEGMLLDARTSLLVALVVGEYSADLAIREVPRHKAGEQLVQKTAVNFWADVAAGKMPRPDYGRDGDVIAELYPPDDAQEAPRDLSASNRIREVLAQREGVKTLLSAAEAECKALDAEIIEALAGSTAAALPGWKITRKIQHRKEVTVAASSFPVLRISKVKAE